MDAVTEQVMRFTHTCFQVTPYESYVDVCEKLNELSPGDHEKRSFLVNSGAEAVENAVKVARYATGRTAVVAFDHGFHGRTLMGMTLTGKAMPYKHGFGPFAPEVYRAPYSYPVQGYREAGRHDHDAPVHRRSRQHRLHRRRTDSRRRRIHRPGTRMAERPCRLVRANGILLVADEVQTGFGRTGTWFACEHEGVIPDIVVTAKSLGGGLPIGGVTGQGRVDGRCSSGWPGRNFRGNPLSCAAALAAIDTIQSDGLLERSTRIGQVMIEQLRSLAASRPVMGDVRGRGSMVAFELVGPRDHAGQGDDRRHRSRLPQAGSARAHRRDLRERDPAAAAAVDPGRSARRGSRNSRQGRHVQLSPRLHHRAFRHSAPARTSRRLSTAHCAMANLVSVVAEPMCGTIMQFGALEDGIVRLRRLIFEHVESRTGDRALGQRTSQCDLIHHRASRGVDEERRGLHERRIRPRR